MKTIKDKMILGVIAGLGGNVIKNILGLAGMRLGLQEIDGPHRAAGMLVPPHKIADPKGKLVGFLADTVMSGTLGIVTLSGLLLFGKKHAILKGSLVGAGMWTILYGIMGNLGATKVNPITPQTVLAEFIEHTIFGAVTAAIITSIADQSVFKNSQNQDQTSQQPISISSYANAVE